MNTKVDIKFSVHNENQIKYFILKTYFIITGIAIFICRPMTLSMPNPTCICLFVHGRVKN